MKVNIRLLLIIILKLFADPKITQLGFTEFWINQNVIWFDVSVHLAADIMQIMDTIYDLKNKQNDKMKEWGYLPSTLSLKLLIQALEGRNLAELVGSIH